MTDETPNPPIYHFAHPSHFSDDSNDPFLSETTKLKFKQIQFQIDNFSSSIQTLSTNIKDTDDRLTRHDNNVLQYFDKNKELFTRNENFHSEITDSLNTKFSEVEKKFKEMNKKIDDNFSEMNKKIDDNFSEMNKKIDNLIKLLTPSSPRKVSKNIYLDPKKNFFGSKC